MATDGVALAIPGGAAAGADIVSGRSPVNRPATGLAPSEPASAGAVDDADRSGSSARADGRGREANSSASRAAQSSGDDSSAAGGSRGAGSSSSGPAGKGRSTPSGNANANSGSSKRNAGSATQGRGASGASSAGAAQTSGAAQATAGANDFAAALAQSLAATPADGAATAGTAAGKSQADAGASSEPAAKHSAAAPVSSALTLLEQALAGVLAGAQSTAAVAGTPGTSTNGTSSGASSPDNGTIDTAGKSSAAALTALLAQNLSPHTQAGGSNSASASGSAASAISAASAATTATASTVAALAAAQLSSGSHVAAQQGTIDSSRMALTSQVGSDAWTDELGAKVTWMAHQGIESASLQLSPEHLGPLQVTISVHNGQASVWFGAAQPDTRTALQQSLPQLRQLFAGQGLTLADAGVSREPPRGQSRQSSSRSTTQVSAVGATNLESSGSRASIIGGMGLLDTYV